MRIYTGFLQLLQQARRHPRIEYQNINCIDLQNPDLTLPFNLLQIKGYHRNYATLTHRGFHAALQRYWIVIPLVGHQVNCEK